MFNVYTIKDVIEEVIDYRGKTPKKLGGDWSEEKTEYMALSAKNIKKGRIVQPDTIRYVDQEMYNKWMKQEVERGTILITSEAPFGELLYWDSDDKIVLSQRLFGLKIKKEFNSRYIYYYMFSEQFQGELSGRATGSTVTGLRQPELLKCHLKIPDRNYQDIIANILMNIDQKIELNNKINNNLFELVLNDFNNFLDKNTDAEMVKLEDCVEKVNTGADAIQRAPIVDYDTGIRCIRIGDMTNGRDYHSWGFTKMTDKDFENYKLIRNDIVITRTAVNGLTYMITDEENTVCNNGNIRLRVNNKYNPLYIYLNTKTKDFRNYIDRINSETSVRPNMKVEYFTSYEIKKIDLEKQNDFCLRAESIMKKIQNNKVENYNLEQLRDTLLPKLMNGEIDLDKINI